MVTFSNKLLVVTHGMQECYTLGISFLHSRLDIFPITISFLFLLKQYARISKQQIFLKATKEIGLALISVFHIHGTEILTEHHEPHKTTHGNTNMTSTRALSNMCVSVRKCLTIRTQQFSF